jgi:hypothetical protein
MMAHLSRSPAVGNTPWFFLNLYLPQILGFSALSSGLALRLMGPALLLFANLLARA